MMMPLKDNKDNAKWVSLVDTLVESNLYANETAILYGGRDSFIPYYTKDGGAYKTIELLPEDNDSGTELRAIATTKIPRYSRENAETIIYTLNSILG